MTGNSYMPEGMLISTAENQEIISSCAALEEAMRAGKILEGMAEKCDSDFSLTVKLGEITGIIPREEAVLTQNGEPVRDIAVITRVGKAVCFKVIGMGRAPDGRMTAILSRRAAQSECRRNYLSALKCGDIIPAKITHMEHFGAFVDIGCGIVSLLSIDCISVSRISHPHDRFRIGERLRVIVKSIDRDCGRIYVSHKELLGTWEENAACFRVGQTVAGIIRSIEEYGIFVELTPNLAGLAEYRDDMVVGQTSAVYIKNIIPERMKLKLVLIDTYRGELPPSKLYNVQLDSTITHMDYWKYSPESSEKIIETVFSSEPA